jgi:hydroxyacylglutathione hydrolase
MNIEQIYTGCLAQGAYFIESDGEAVVIDPLREIEPYLERADKAGARIKYIFETHIHADFVSGHLELAEKTGATIVYGPMAETSFFAHIGHDGERFQVGKLEFELLHTPGHTMESSCFLLKNDEGKSIALFTGDTLFIGDVGRPDLAQKASAGITQESLAGLLFKSLHNKIFHLPDDLVIYPAHGAGSACGKNISKETSDTLGNQKKTNYALRVGISPKEFIKEVTEGLQPPPAYFPVNVKLNQEGADHLHDVMAKGARGLSLFEFEQAWKEEDALVLDTRDAAVFAKGFIPSAINIGLNGSFAPWVGSLIPYKSQPILLVTDEGLEKEVVTRLARIGYDDTIGFLKGGFKTWERAERPKDYVEQVSAADMIQSMTSGLNSKMIDVRKEIEYTFSHLKGASNLPLDQINGKQQDLNRSQRYYVYCAGGYRSMIFVSILKARGYKHLVNIEGGYSAMTKITEFAVVVNM